MYPAPVLFIMFLLGPAVAVATPPGIRAFAPEPDDWRLVQRREMSPNRTAYVVTGHLGSSGRGAAVVSTEGIVLLPSPPGGLGPVEAWGLSRDSRFVAGMSERSSSLGDTAAVLWSDGVPELLPDLAPSGGGSAAFDVSADGRVVVGSSGAPIIPVYVRHAVRWIDGAVEALPVPPGAERSEANFVSDDGTVIVGHAYTATEQLWIRWRGDEMELLPPLPNDIRFFTQTGISADGETVLGMELGPLQDGVGLALVNDAWQVVTDLPTGRTRPIPLAADRTGRVVTGRGFTGAPADIQAVCRRCPEDGLGILWTPETGTLSLKDFLVHGCGLPLEAWTLGEGFVSDDGRHLAFSGEAPDVPFGRYRVPIAECRLDYAVPQRPPGPGSIFFIEPQESSLYHGDVDGWIDLFASGVGPVRELEIGPDRKLYVMYNFSYSLVGRIDLHTRELEILTEQGLIRNAFAFTVDRNGAPWVLASDGLGGSRLVEIGPGGVQSERATWPILPRALAREPRGTLAVLLDGAADAELHRFDPASATSSLLAHVAGGHGLVVGPEGGLFVGVDYGSFARIHPETGVVTYVPTAGGHGRSLLGMDLDGSLLAWRTRSYLARIDQDTGEVAPGPGSSWIRGPSVIEGSIAVLRPACRDGLDNDGDDSVDFPDDPDCEGIEDDTEGPAPPLGCGAGHELAYVLVPPLLARSWRRRTTR